MRLNQEKIERMFNARGGTASGGSGGSEPVAGMATQAWTEENYISKTFFNELFIIHKKTTTTVYDGDVVVSTTVDTSGIFAPNEIPSQTESTDAQTGYRTVVETEVDNIEAKEGLWTDFFLSALGLNPGGGGGGSDTLADLLDVELDNPTANQVLTYYNGKWRNMAVPGVDMNAVWQALGDTTTTQQIAHSHLTTALNGYATQQWVGQQGFLTSSALNGYATQTWVTNQGYLTAITSSQITTALGYTPADNASLANYLPLIGGTMTGAIKVNAPGGAILQSSSNHIQLHISNNFTILGYDNTKFQIPTYIDGYNIYFRSGNSASDGYGTINAVLSSDGCFGIGTTPSYRLHVNGSVFFTYGYSIRNNTYQTEAFCIRGNSNGQYIRIMSGEDGLGITDSTIANTFQIRNMKTYAELCHNTGMPLYINTGNVGIGVLSPSQKLDVNGNITTASSDGTFIQIGGIRLVYDATNTALKVVQSDGTTAANFYATGGVSALGQTSGGGGVGDVTWELLADNTDTRQIALSHLTTALSGYVTNASLSNYLALSGGTMTGMITSTSGNGAIISSRDGHVLLHISGDHAILGYDNTKYLKPTYIDGYTIYFRSGNSGTGGYGEINAILTSDGSVGIGTQTPGYKLTVNGSFYASSIVVNGDVSQYSTGYTWIHTGNISQQNVLSAKYTRSLGDYVYTASNAPTDFDLGISTWFTASGSGYGSYGSVLNVRSYNGGGGSLQLYIPYSPIYGGTHMKARFSIYGEPVSSTWTLLKEIAWTEDIPTDNNQLANGAGYITGITSSMISTALGYTPANNASLANYLPLAGGEMSGTIRSDGFILATKTGKNVVYVADRYAIFGYDNPLYLYPTYIDGYQIYFRSGNSGTGGYGDINAILNQNGNFGIGTTSPSEKIHVVGNGYFSGMLYTDISVNFKTNGSDVSYIGKPSASNDDFVIVTYSANPIRLYTNSTERVRITSSGDVGIGTSSPSYKLTINNGSIYFSYGYSIRNITNFGTEAFDIRGNNNGQYIRIMSGEDGLGITDSAITNTFQIRNMRTYAELCHNTGMPLYINTGNVGIGTASPSYKLHVAGAIYSTTDITANNALYVGQGIILNPAGAATTNGGFLDFRYAGAGSYTSRIIEDASGRLYLSATNGVRIGDAVLRWESNNNALRIESPTGGAVNFYATGGVSALGISGAVDGTVNASLIPSATETYTLGSSSKRWKKLYLGDSNTSFEIEPYPYQTYISSTKDISINNKVEITSSLYVEYFVGIGSSNTNYDLYVWGDNGGNAYFYGNVSVQSLTQRSDMRLKDVVSDLNLKVSTIAQAPSFKYRLKNGDGTIMVGSSAQYWDALLPEVIHRDAEGILGLDYGVTALASVIAVAKEVTEHERRIARLEAENAILRAQIEDLKAA